MREVVLPEYRAASSNRQGHDLKHRALATNTGKSCLVRCDRFEPHLFWAKTVIEGLPWTVCLHDQCKTRARGDLLTVGGPRRLTYHRRSSNIQRMTDLACEYALLPHGTQRDFIEPYWNQCMTVKLAFLRPCLFLNRLLRFPISVRIKLCHRINPIFITPFN